MHDDKQTLPYLTMFVRNLIVSDGDNACIVSCLDNLELFRAYRFDDDLFLVVSLHLDW